MREVTGANSVVLGTRQARDRGNMEEGCKQIPDNQLGDTRLAGQGGNGSRCHNE
jgi:hypothetical protein